MTITEFNKKFPTEEAAIDYFLQVRYHGLLTCPRCGSLVKVYRVRKRAKVCSCKACDTSFSPFAGTIFEKSRTDMRAWFYAIHLMLNTRKGVSACQLERELGVTYKTAWRMLHLIREAMGNEDMVKAFKSFVEIDETYIGGRPRKTNVVLDAAGKVVPPSEAEKVKRGRGTKKTPVVGVKERKSKKVYAQVALPNEEGKKLSGKQLLAVLDKVCEDETTVASDDFRGYNILDHGTANKFSHVMVNHSLGQYSAGNGVHTNNIENFWSVLKRGITGMYHHVSVKHLQEYVDEFCFRQNNRENEGVFDTLLGQCVRK
jgi:transposase-like protein